MIYQEARGRKKKKREGFVVPFFPSFATCTHRNALARVSRWKFRVQQSDCGVTFIYGKHPAAVKCDERILRRFARDDRGIAEVDTAGRRRVGNIGRGGRVTSLTERDSNTAEECNYYFRLLQATIV